MIIIKKNGAVVDNYSPSYIGQEIVIAIDSSKSNTAIMVGTTDGVALDDYEISGGGKDTDVYELCAFTRNQIKRLFDDADIKYVGIENIITKKESEYHGMEIHQSRYKITAVFDNFIFTFQEFFKIMPKLINNQAWKYEVLPEEYRKRTHKKGSKDYLASIGNKYGFRKDDVSDAYCIYQYIMRTVRFEKVESINSISPCSRKYIYCIVPDNANIEGARKFKINNSSSLQHNMMTVVSKLDKDECGQFKWKIEDIPLEDIYSNKTRIVGKTTFSPNDEYAIILVYPQE